MYNSWIKTQTVAAIAGAKTTPTMPRYCAVINKNRYILWKKLDFLDVQEPLMIN